MEHLGLALLLQEVQQILQGALLLRFPSHFLQRQQHSAALRQPGRPERQGIVVQALIPQGQPRPGTEGNL